MKNKMNLTFLAILVVSVVSALVLLLHPAPFSTEMPIYSALIGVVGFGGFLSLYIFARTNFSYVLYHAKFVAAGSATVIELDSGLTTIHLGIKAPAKKITVDLQELPKTTLFFGRWEVYSDKSSGYEFWHDHTLFGGNWYYILH